MKKLFITILAILLVLTISCANRDKAEYKMQSEKEMIEEKKEMAKDEGYGEPAPDMADMKEVKGEGDNSSEKIVKSISLEINTMTFDDDRMSFDSLLKKYNAIISNSEVNISDMEKKNHSRYLFYTVRVDQKKLDEFKKEMEASFNVVYISESKQNITDQYYDAEGRLENLKIQRDRIRELLKKAEEIEDIIQLEERLSELDYQIESYTTDLNRMDKDVNYSFVNVSMHEVKDPSKLTKSDDSSFGIRIKTAFVDGFKGLVYFGEEVIIFVISVLPLLIIIGVVAFFVIKYLRKKKQ